jgi:capsular polysaccharide biosynthesis protein
VSPTTPYAPQIVRSAFIGTALSVVLNVVSVVFREYLGDTVRSSDQFARLARSPMLASVARMPSLGRGSSGLPVLDD